jgi:hypothetical protein
MDERLDDFSLCCFTSNVAVEARLKQDWPRSELPMQRRVGTRWDVANNAALKLLHESCRKAEKCSTLGDAARQS